MHPNNMYRKIIKGIIPNALKQYIVRKNEAKRLVAEIESTIRKFELGLSENDFANKKQQILGDCKEYKCTPIEWYLFDFNKRTDEEKKEYLPDYYKNEWSVGTDLKLYWELTDKYWFYNKNKDFFKRRAIQLDQETNFEEFASFCKECGTVFIKPLSAAFGYNTFKYKYNDTDIRALFDKLVMDRNSYKLSSLTKFGFIVEELIVQDDHLGIFNESSVNTVRVPSVLTEKGHYVLGCFFRTGRKGAVIDNAGGGGIFAALDDETGVAITDGYDESCNSYVVHPDSGIAYKGFQIKDWKELIEITQKAHENMPNHKYIAYDFAYTDKGWVMLEGNFGQFIGQFATKQGLKSKFYSMMFG